MRRSKKGPVLLPKADPRRESDSAVLDRAIMAAGPGKTTSVGSGDLERIDQEFERIRRIGS